MSLGIVHTSSLLVYEATENHYNTHNLNSLMRTFVAIEIHNEKLLNEIAKIQLEFKIKGTAVSKKNMHFTLFFLGEISAETAENVKQNLSLISFKKIELFFTHIGVFPNPKFPRVVWIGIDETSSKQLIDLANQITNKLESLGFKPDKPFKPHLTIFRIKDKVADISQTLEKFQLTSHLEKEVVTELKLKQSILTPNGPIYSDLQVVLAK